MKKKNQMKAKILFFWLDFFFFFGGGASNFENGLGVHFIVFQREMGSGILPQLNRDLLMLVVEFYGLQQQQWTVLSSVNQKFRDFCRSAPYLSKVFFACQKIADLEALARLDHCKAIRSLRLENSSFSREEMHVGTCFKFMASSLPNLVHLRCDQFQCGISNDGAQVLSSLCSLTTVRLNFCSLSEDILKALPPTIRSLDLSCSWFFDRKMVQALSKLPMLSVLDLSISKITDDVLVLLVSIPERRHTGALVETNKPVRF